MALMAMCSSTASSRQVFGDKNFAGIHDTFHNHLTNDGAWATGIDWWTIPRQYGMSDKDLLLPLRMGRCNSMRTIARC